MSAACRTVSGSRGSPRLGIDEPRVPDAHVFYLADKIGPE